MMALPGASKDEYLQRTSNPSLHRMMQGGIFMKKRTARRWPVSLDDAVFFPAITPMEAAMLPAEGTAVRKRGALRLHQAAMCQKFDGGQRTKIWVR